MAKHAKPQQTARRVSVTDEAYEFLYAMMQYRKTENPDLLGPVTRKFADLLPPYNGGRKREPGRHARTESA